MSIMFTIPPTARRALERMAADVARVFGGRLVAVVATSPASSVIFANDLAPGDLVALEPLVETWHREGLDTPLLISPEEFRRSLDAFPVEYQAMIDRHVVMSGRPPFEGALVPRSDLRRACEVQAKGHLIHLRQGWLEGGADADARAALIARSAAPLRAILTTVARLHDAASGADAAMTGARLAGLPERLVHDVLALEQAADDEARVDDLPAYLAACERLWAFVDEWRAAS
jgi:hypothetical protein